MADPENPLVGASIWVVSSAEAKLRCGGIFNDSFIANFLRIVIVKEFQNRPVNDEVLQILFSGHGVVYVEAHCVANWSVNL